MRRQSLRRFAFLPLVAIALFGGIAYTAPQSDQSDRGVAPIYGITIPTGYRDWKVVSVAHEAGRLNDLRAVSAWGFRSTLVDVGAEWIGERNRFENVRQHSACGPVALRRRRLRAKPIDCQASRAWRRCVTGEFG
jgi:hypothetical protein